MAKTKRAVRNLTEDRSADCCVLSLENARLNRAIKEKRERLVELRLHVQTLGAGHRLLPVGLDLIERLNRQLETLVAERCGESQVVPD